MANSAASGFATGFFKARTESINEDKDAARKLGEQIRLLQLKSLQEQEARFSEIGSAVDSISSDVESDNIEAAYAKAVDAKFGGMTSKQFKEYYGSKVSSVDGTGKFHPEDRDKIKADLARLVSEWKTSTKDVDFTAMTAEALSSKLAINKKHIDSADGVIKSMLGMNGNEYSVDTTSAFKGLRKMYRDPSMQEQPTFTQAEEESISDKRLMYEGGLGSQGRPVQTRIRDNQFEVYKDDEGWTPAKVTDYAASNRAPYQGGTPTRTVYTFVDPVTRAKYQQNVLTARDDPNAVVASGGRVRIEAPPRVDIRDDDNAIKKSDKGVQDAARAVAKWGEKYKEWADKNLLDQNSSTVSTNTPLYTYWKNEADSLATLQQGNLGVAEAADIAFRRTVMLHAIGMGTIQKDGSHTYPTAKALARSPDLQKEFRKKAAAAESKLPNALQQELRDYHSYINNFLYPYLREEEEYATKQF